jgi:adhesin transport system outer membrane protein
MGRYTQLHPAHPISSEVARPMKLHFGATIAAVGLVASLAPAGQAQAQALEELVRTALETHPKLQTARSTARASGFEVTQAEAAWSPRVNLITDPGRTFRLANGTRSLQTGDIGVRGSQLVYDGGKTDAEIERQKARLTASEQRLLATAEQLSGQIADLYLEALKQSRLAGVASDNVAAHEDLVKRVQEIVSVDRGRASELTQAQARLEQARVTYQVRQSANIEAVAQLTSLLNRSVRQV